MARLTLSPEHIAPVSPSVFEILALILAHINTINFCLENRLSPEICWGRNIFIIYWFFGNSGGRLVPTNTGYCWRFFLKSWHHLTHPGIFRLWPLISRKWCEIATKSLLFTNRKSYTAFRMVQNLLTSGDLEVTTFGLAGFDFSGSPGVIGDVTNRFFA